MSKQANKKLVGIFVLGAIALSVAAIMVFGSGSFLAKQAEFALYFEGSVKGLTVGAPVMFRGVKIGAVKDIQLQFSAEDVSVRIPVIIEIDQNKLVTSGNLTHSREQKGMAIRLKELIDHGLRAQLQLQSVVTGQLMVDFDFYPDKPLNLSGIKNQYPEIPTIPSGLEELTRRLENLPLDALFTRVLEALEEIRDLARNPDVTGSFKALNETLQDTRSLVRHVNSQILPLVSSIRNASDAAGNAFVQAEKTLSLEEGAPAELAARFKDAFISTQSAMEQTRETLTSFRRVAAEDSSLIYEVNNTLKELSSAARSIRFLADYLEQHPEALLRGK